jgi:hypothetical protein
MERNNSNFLSQSQYAILLICILVCYDSNSAAISQSTANEVYKRVSPAVVLIKTDKGAGTGFIIASTGIIATALHVVDGASKVAVKTQAGDIFDGVSLLAKDERRDVAILKVGGFDLPTVNLGNSNDLNPGDQVFVIGNPLGAEQLQTSISNGIVSGIRDLGDGYKVIQVTAPISPGNSGGPALSASGDAIGMVVFRLREGQSLNFAVPINYLRGLLDSIDVNKPLAQWKNASGAESVLSEKASSKVTRWKSLASGTTKLLRYEGDYIYIETELPEETRKLGVFMLGEVKKQGDKYVGTFRARLIWWQMNQITGEKVVTRACLFEEPVELTLVTTNRIEGREFGPANGAKLDYKKCKYSKADEWKSFVWIPE